MNRDILTLVSLGALSVLVVIGYQNFDRTSKASTLGAPTCAYNENFVKLGELKNFTPIVYTLENRQVWKGQSGAGPFQKISPDKESIINFKIIETGKIQALAESQPMEYSLLETKDDGETWMIVGNISELDLNATLYDAVEYKGKVVAALKFLNGTKSFLRLLEKDLTAASWQKLKEIEIEGDTVASLGKDLSGNLFLAYTVGNKINVERRTSDSAFSSWNEYQIQAPYSLVPSSFMGTAVDNQGSVRIFVNVKTSDKSGSLVVTFVENKETQVSELLDHSLVTTSMAVSEDGTISLNGIKKAPGAVATEAFLRINTCKRTF
jgi:hypothetical protein